MGYIGGQLLTIKYNHPTLGTGLFACKSSEDSTINLGGIRTDSAVTDIAGDGQAVRKMNLNRWMLDTTIAFDSTAKAQSALAQLAALAADPNEAIWTATHISGSVYSGSGFPVDVLDGNLGTATIKLKLEGSNQLVETI